MGKDLLLGSPVGELAPQVTEGLLRRVEAFRKRFQWEPLHHLAVVPLVLSGPLCPFGTSPHPVGSHP